MKSTISKEQLQNIAIIFEKRTKNCNIKTKKYKEEDFNYWIGVSVTLESLNYKIPPAITICLMSGRLINKLILDK